MVDLSSMSDDFRNFLVKNGDGDYVLQLESYFQSDYIDDNGIRKFLLWSNLEKAIGQYDLEELYVEVVQNLSVTIGIIDAVRTKEHCSWKLSISLITIPKFFKGI